MAKKLNYHQRRLKEKKQEIEILKQIVQLTTYNLSLKQVLEAVVDIVSEYTRSDSCFIYLVEKDQVILEASKNPHKAALGRVKMRVGEGITGWVAEKAKPVAISERAYEDKRFKLFNSLPEDRFEAFISMPVVFKDKVVGVINVQYAKKIRLNKEKLAFVEMIAQLVGGTIENARLIFETNFLKEALETRKLLDRAKSILMNKGGLTETEAHKLINKKSMDKRKSVKEVAEAIILSQEIMGRIFDKKA
ncbi:MAG: GAF domain-containing protein [Patescibacteria group bacterium]|nr:ANTAR domain-containing protein [Patescibacteria group bacterium]